MNKRDFFWFCDLVLRVKCKAKKLEIIIYRWNCLTIRMRGNLSNINAKERIAYTGLRHGGFFFENGISHAEAGQWCSLSGNLFRAQFRQFSSQIQVQDSHTQRIRFAQLTAASTMIVMGPS